MAVERKFIDEAVNRMMLKEYLHRETARAGFGNVDIQRNPMGTRIVMEAERPGLVIGRGGRTIKRITREVEAKFDLENPQIEVNEVDRPNLAPQVMAQRLAEALERGWHFRRAGRSTLRRIMDSGAKGCQVTLSGKLTGQRSRTQKFVDGHIKHCGETSEQWMDRGFAVAKKKLGTVGVKIEIMDPEARLPDEITVGGPGRTPEDVEKLREEREEPEYGEAEITDLPGIGASKAEALGDAGFDELIDLARADVDNIAEAEGVGPKLAERIKQELKKLER